MFPALQSSSREERSLRWDVMGDPATPPPPSPHLSILQPWLSVLSEDDLFFTVHVKTMDQFTEVNFWMGLSLQSPTEAVRARHQMHQHAAKAVFT